MNIINLRMKHEEKPTQSYQDINIYDLHFVSLLGLFRILKYQVLLTKCLEGNLSAWVGRILKSSLCS